jgi:leucyl-tRNA synthetase
MGHTESYTASDIIYRYKKLQGFDVLHPQGFDSFGLPAENYAIKTGIHPKETTKKNTDNYIRQMKMLGLGHDLDHLVYTSEPSYYKWTQWLFGKFFENGLVEQKTDKINWCPSCNTGIANEQVENGKCERCKTEIEQKEVPGWFFKITDFAEDLIKDLDKVDWPESTKKNQRNWIGKSVGAKINFKLKILNSNSNSNKKISNVIMVHGCPSNKEKSLKKETRTYDKHWQPWIKEQLEKINIKADLPLMPHPWAPVYEEHKREFEKMEINSDTVLIGHSCGANFLVQLS